MSEMVPGPRKLPPRGLLPTGRLADQRRRRSFYVGQRARVTSSRGRGAGGQRTAVSDQRTVAGSSSAWTPPPAPSAAPSPRSSGGTSRRAPTARWSTRRSGASSVTGSCCRSPPFRSPQREVHVADARASHCRGRLPDRGWVCAAGGCEPVRRPGEAPSWPERAGPRAPSPRPSAVFRVLEVEPCSGIPLRALVAVGRHARRRP